MINWLSITEDLTSYIISTKHFSREPIYQIKKTDTYVKKIIICIRLRTYFMKNTLKHVWYKIEQNIVINIE